MNGGAELKFSSDVLSSIVVDVDPTRSSTRAPLSSFENNSQIGIYGIPGVDGGRNESCNLRDCKFESDFQKYLFNGRYTYVSGYDELQSEFQATYPSRANPALYLYCLLYTSQRYNPFYFELIAKYGERCRTDYYSLQYAGDCK